MYRLYECYLEIVNRTIKSLATLECHFCFSSSCFNCDNSVTSKTFLALDCATIHCPHPFSPRARMHFPDEGAGGKCNKDEPLSHLGFGERS